uniref:Uncharacterized protein n=1 Tax=Cucumis melo TaxID=3656 RepID=A0A9I9EH12_CUCME
MLDKLSVRRRLMRVLCHSPPKRPSHSSRHVKEKRKQMIITRWVTEARAINGDCGCGRFRREGSLIKDVFILQVLNHSTVRNLRRRRGRKKQTLTMERSSSGSENGRGRVVGTGCKAASESPRQ